MGDDGPYAQGHGGEARRVQDGIEVLAGQGIGRLGAASRRAGGGDRWDRSGDEDDLQRGPGGRAEGSEGARQVQHLRASAVQGQS